MYDNILIPVDGSEVAENAATYAIQEAQSHDATLHVISVLSIHAHESPEAGTTPLAHERRTENAESFIESVTNQAPQDMEVATDVLVGQPHTQICSYAESHDIDLIVMGTHGRSGVKRVLLGSVTERVVRTSSAPVMTVQE